MLERPIPGSHRQDAMGPYPRLFCRNWSKLSEDVTEASEQLVSLTLVTEPFAKASVADLACFDGVRPYKEHYVVDLTLPLEESQSRHHRYYARWALREGVSVEQCDEPRQLLDEWMRLYNVLVERHHLTGLKRFSRRSFEGQLSVPGATMFRARKGGTTVAAQVWYRHGDVAHSHLQATDDSGYRSRAAYALYSEALQWLKARCRLADLGSAAGATFDARDGLARFKRGWASETRQAYICSRVFDRKAYDCLVRAHGAPPAAYFPRYRANEPL